MRNVTCMLDGEVKYCSGSVIPEIEDITNSDLLESILPKQLPIKGVFMLSGPYPFTVHDYFGPQRWSNKGDKLELTSEEGMYLDPEGNVFYDESIAEEYGLTADSNPDYIAFGTDPTEINDLPKVISKDISSWYGTEDGQKFLDAGFHEDFEEDLKEESIYQNSAMILESYNDEVSIETADIVQKVDGGISKEELSFWRRMVWCISHSPKSALELCKTHSNCEWFTIEAKEWIWEIIKSDVYYMNHKAECKTNPEYKLERKMSYVRYVFLKWSMFRKINKTKSRGLVCIDFFPATDTLKEGFMNIWCTVNGKVIKTEQRTHFKDSNKGLLQLALLEQSCIAKGFKLRVTKMDPAKQNYKNARILWLNTKEYIAKRS